MRRILFLVFIVIPLAAAAQKTMPFEGEIVYETYENYSDYMLRMANSIMFNGVHKVHVTVKGSKIHQYDETTGCHVIGDDDTKTFVHFCDHTKSGMDYSKNIESQLMLLPRDITYNNFTSVIKEYTFTKTDTLKTILGYDCHLYSGTILRDMTIDQTYYLWAYVSDSIPAPVSYNYHIWGLDIPNVALKWIMKYDGGHVGMGVGELSLYIEADVIDINPRSVSDDEFTIPSDYKISQGSANAFALVKYYGKIKKQLERLGIKGGNQSEKTTGVHYKTEGEWDF